MPKKLGRARFVSKYQNHEIVIRPPKTVTLPNGEIEVKPGKSIVFERSELITDDPEIIDHLRNKCKFKDVDYTEDESYGKANDSNED